MKRSSLKRDPEKIRAWQERSRGSLKRGSGPKRRKKGMRREPRKRTPAERERDKIEQRAFKEEARRQRVCAVCGRAGNDEKGNPVPWEAHHVITKAYLKRYGHPLWHPDNSLRVCSEPCHGQHTRGFKRMPLSCLTDRNIAYAVTLLGEPKAHEYLTRHYSGEDPRVDALLDDMSEEYEEYV